MPSPSLSSTCHPTFTNTALAVTTTSIPLQASDSFLRPICLFKSTMRIPKKPVSFCLSFFSPPLSHSLSPRLTLLAPSSLLFPSKGKPASAGGLSLFFLFAVSFFNTFVFGDFRHSELMRRFLFFFFLFLFVVLFDFELRIFWTDWSARFGDDAEHCRE